jgi:hypothetical protein
VVWGRRQGHEIPVTYCKHRLNASLKKVENTLYSPRTWDVFLDFLAKAVIFRRRRVGDLDACVAAFATVTCVGFHPSSIKL